MKLQPESKKELTRIACGTAICTAVMWVIFAALHLVGWVKFDYTVVLGSLIGAAVAIGNFAGICIVCQKVIDEQDEKRRKATLQASYNVRMLLQAVWIIVSIGAPCFQPFASVLALAVPACYDLLPANNRQVQAPCTGRALGGCLCGGRPRTRPGSGG
mgnify:CR=1 FL=1